MKSFTIKYIIFMIVSTIWIGSGWLLGYHYDSTERYISDYISMETFAIISLSLGVISAICFFITIRDGGNSIQET